MTAQDLIEECVQPEYRDKAHIRAEIPGSWWHVHRDEELPDKPILVVIRK